VRGDVRTSLRRESSVVSIVSRKLWSSGSFCKRPRDFQSTMDLGGTAPKSMCFSIKPVAQITRIGGVWTPPENRRRGYAAACVYSLSKLERDAGHWEILRQTRFTEGSGIEPWQTFCVIGSTKPQFRS
jgi:hypothetical protein